MDFTNRNLNCKDFSPIKGKTETNSFLSATENTFFSMKILSKNVLAHLSVQLDGEPFLLR